MTTRPGAYHRRWPILLMFDDFCNIAGATIVKFAWGFLRVQDGHELILWMHGVVPMMHIRRQLCPALVQAGQGRAHAWLRRERLAFPVRVRDPRPGGLPQGCRCG